MYKDWAYLHLCTSRGAPWTRKPAGVLELSVYICKSSKSKWDTEEPRKESGWHSPSLLHGSGCRTRAGSPAAQGSPSLGTHPGSPAGMGDRGTCWSSWDTAWKDLSPRTQTPPQNLSGYSKRALKRQAMREVLKTQRAEKKSITLLSKDRGRVNTQIHLQRTPTSIMLLTLPAF